MYSDCRDISDRIHIPDFLEELLLGKYMVWIFRKECEQVKFLCGKLLFLSVYPNTAGCFVNLDATNFNDVIFRCGASDQALISGQMSLYPGYKL